MAPRRRRSRVARGSRNGLRRFRLVCGAPRLLPGPPQGYQAIEPKGRRQTPITPRFTTSTGSTPSRWCARSSLGEPPSSALSLSFARARRGRVGRTVLVHVQQRLGSREGPDEDEGGSSADPPRSRSTCVQLRGRRVPALGALPRRGRAHSPSHPPRTRPGGKSHAPQHLARAARNRFAPSKTLSSFSRCHSL